MAGGVAEEELDLIISRRVERGVGVVIVIEVETLGVLNAVVTHGVVEEEDVEMEAIDVVESVEVAGEEIVTTVVEAIDVRGDDGKLDVVDTIELADNGEIVNAGDEVVAGDVEHTEDVVGDGLADVIVDEGVVAMVDEDGADIVERKPRDVVESLF
jgi:hypothetical protein